MTIEMISAPHLLVFVFDFSPPKTILISWPAVEEMELINDIRYQNQGTYWMRCLCGCDG